MLSIIAACDANELIGLNGRLPWRDPEDLRYFRAYTLGKTVLMGRKTWESLGSRPLQGRHNLIVTKSREINAYPGKWIVRSFPTLDDALRFNKNIIVTGGADLYAQCLPLASEIDLMKFDFETPTKEGDIKTYWPKFDYKPWTIVGTRLRNGTRWVFKK